MTGGSLYLSANLERSYPIEAIQNESYNYQRLLMAAESAGISEAAQKRGGW